MGNTVFRKSITITLILLCMLTFQDVKCAYVVHSVKGDVTVIHKGSTEAARTGMTLQPSDILEIGSSGHIDIINDVSKVIYSSTKTGKTTVSRMMLDAKSSSSDKLGSVNKHLRFGNSHDNNTRVYVETGMVKRSLADYDPDASGMAMDAESLALCIHRFLTGREEGKKIPGEFTRIDGDDNVRKGFKLLNTTDFPVYFNVIHIDGSGDDCHAEISEFGQPSGCYVLLSGHSMMRSTIRDFESGRHVIIAAPCQFDIDATLEVLNKELKNESTSGVGIVEMPVYVEGL